MKNGSGYLTPKTINENKVGSKGLYDPTFEHDSCGIGFLANLDGRQENIIIEHALTISERLEHRVAGCEANTGDGAGLLIQIPDEFRKIAVNQEKSCPALVTMDPV